MRTEVLGVGFDPVTVDEAVLWALPRLKTRDGAAVCTPNPEIVWACRKNAALRAAVNSAQLVLADGTGVVWASRMLRRPLPGRVAGADFCGALLGTMKGRVYLLGGKPGTALRAAQNIEKQYPGVRVCGAADGYFTREDDAAAAVAAASPDLLLVCLGSPKQELFMARNRHKLNTGVMAGLGGYLDILAGDAPRAPEMWRKRGLEWLYRLLREPRRIKRQAVIPLYMAAVIAQRLKHE